MCAGAIVILKEQFKALNTYAENKKGQNKIIIHFRSWERNNKRNPSKVEERTQ